MRNCGHLSSLSQLNCSYSTSVDVQYLRNASSRFRGRLSTKKQNAIDCIFSPSFLSDAHTEEFGWAKEGGADPSRHSLPLPPVLAIISYLRIAVTTAVVQILELQPYTVSLCSHLLQNQLGRGCVVLTKRLVAGAASEVLRPSAAELDATRPTHLTRAYP